jgi:glucose-6-phosphate isomerase
VVNALEDWIDQDKNFHFVSNVDGHELGHVLRRVKPESTLFLIASKSFTTAETMLNARSARQWFLDHGGSEDPQAPCSIDQHFVALTTNTQAAAEFGIQRTLGFWDWVGGRFSLWSAIGLPIAIAIGSEQFRALLDGAHAMDAHFFTAPMESNLPVRLGLLDVWYRNFCQFSSRCIAPYSHGLRRLTAYLQQLEMESNGKSINKNGVRLTAPTAPVIWGEPGTNGQHAFSRCCIRGGCHTGRIHCPARRGQIPGRAPSKPGGQRHCPGPGADGGALRRRSGKRLSRQSPQQFPDA